MKLFPFIGALLVSTAPADSVATPDKSADDERNKGFYYGYVYGLGNTLCGLAADKLITKEYAQKLFAEIPDLVKKDPDAKDYASSMDIACRDIIQDVACKEVFQ